MGNGKKFFNKKKKSGLQPTTKKKRKLLKEKEATINKKALFNRYKNKQKVEEVLIKKKQMEKRFQQQQVVYSESEEEEDAYGQLVSCFSKVKKGKVAESDESMSEDGSVISGGLESGSEMDNEQEGINNEPLEEVTGDEKEGISDSDRSDIEEEEMPELGVYCPFY